MAKILKSNKKGVANYVLNKLRINQHIEKLYYYLIGFIMINHLSACFWYYIARLLDFDNDTWVTRLGYIDYSEGDVYFYIKIDVYNIVLF